MNIDITEVIKFLLGLITMFLSGLFGAFCFYYREVYVMKPLQKQALAKALYTEINTLQESLSPVNLAEYRESKSSPREMTFSETAFTVYENNTDKLGMFDPDKVNKIVECYHILRVYINERKALTERWNRYVFFKRDYYNEYYFFPMYKDELNTRSKEVDDIYETVEITEKQLIENIRDVNIILKECFEKEPPGFFKTLFDKISNPIKSLCSGFINFIKVTNLDDELTLLENKRERYKRKLEKIANEIDKIKKERVKDNKAILTNTIKQNKITIDELKEVLKTI